MELGGIFLLEICDEPLQSCNHFLEAGLSEVNLLEFGEGKDLNAGVFEGRVFIQSFKEIKVLGVIEKIQSLFISLLVI